MRGFEARQEARRRAYMIAFGVILLAGGAVLVLAFVARASKGVHERFYRDPTRLLVRLGELETLYFVEKKRYGSLAELEQHQLVTSEVASGEVAGYRYRVIRADASGFALTADPGPALVGSTTHFYTDQTHMVRAEENAPATEKSQVIWSPRDGRSR